MDIRILISFLVVVVLVGICSAIILGAISTAEERLRIAVQQTSDFHFRILEEKLADLQTIEKIVTRTERLVQKNDPETIDRVKKIRAAMEKPRTYDFESSQRATLEEFKEQ